MFSERNELLESVACFADVINIDGLQGLAVLNQQKHLPRFVGAIETFNVTKHWTKIRVHSFVRASKQRSCLFIIAFLSLHSLQKQSNEV